MFGFIIDFLKKLFYSLPYFKYNHINNLDNTVDNFESKYNATSDIAADPRRKEYGSVTATFYNLITDFYEYGWGQSFHFAPRFRDETFQQSIKRYEHWVASKLNVPEPVPEGYTILDCGCGIGGPMRTISRFFQYKAKVIGVNITEEHLRRAKKYNEKQRIRNVELVKCDFNEMPFPDNSIDAGYDFEATLHSTDLERTFREIYRVLKPGARFVTLQYCLLDNYNEKSQTHADIIRRIDNTNGCYVAGRHYSKTTKWLENAGFRILSRENSFDHSDIPFHGVFENQKFTGSKAGRMLTYAFCYAAEAIGAVPKGTTKVQTMLMGAAESFQEGGSLGIVTPGMVYILEKPLKSK